MNIALRARVADAIAIEIRERKVAMVWYKELRDCAGPVTVYVTFGTNTKKTKTNLSLVRSIEVMDGARRLFAHLSSRRYESISSLTHH